MKVNGNGQAKVLIEEELALLFVDGFDNARDRALFGICLYTGCRISEALALTLDDIKGDTVTLKKATTKGQKGTRSIPVHRDLKTLLDEYLAEFKPKGWLFAGKNNSRNGEIGKALSRAGADLILRQACERVGLVGVSTHSFRRTALTRMANGGVPLSVIQRVSGHSSLATLQRYLEVKEGQIMEAIAVI